LQGYDDYGAAVALWGSSDTGFTVFGVFRDMAELESSGQTRVNLGDPSRVRQILRHPRQIWRRFVTSWRQVFRICIKSTIGML